MREIVVDQSPYEVEAFCVPTSAVSALQVIQQSTSLDLGWEDNSPIIWEPIDFLRELSDINLRLISPPLGDLLDLKTLDLHNTSLAGEIQNLESLQHVEKLLTNPAGEPVIKSVRTKEEGRNNGEALLSPLQILATVSGEKAMGSFQLSYAKIC
ncbi:hypothetical protein D5086_029962 [Populus alba]|uniref:Uncharacterized protein n=1 Tax=Populus alba TaxID=43335 RepID=A0ACC4AMA7_POPAL